GRTRSLPPDKLLSLLETRGSQLLSGGFADMPARHQALWRAIEWSHALLSFPERALFRRLAAFPGGFALEGAERVCSMREGEDILGDLQSLVEKNLVVQTMRAGDPWYSMYVPIREFAEQQLAQSGEHDAAMRRRSEYYRKLAEEAEPDIDRPAGARWSGLLERELPNILAAVGWSIADSVEVALRILTSLERFMSIRGHFQDAHDWLKRALAAARDSPGIERLRAKATIAAANNVLGPPGASEATGLAEQGVALWRAVGDASGLAHGLLVLGVARCYRARAPVEVLPCFEECASLCRAADDSMGLSHALFFQALVTYIQGDLPRTKLLVEEEHQLAAGLRDLPRLAGSAALRGLLAVDSGDYGAADRFIDEGHQIIGRTPDKAGQYYIQCCRGGLAFLKGDFSRARSAFQQAADEGFLYPEYSQPIGKLSLGLVSLREGKLEESRGLFREGLNLLRGADHAWGRQNLCACLAGMAGIRNAERCHASAARILEAARPVLTAPYLRLAWGHDYSLTPGLISTEYARISSEVRSALGPEAQQAFSDGQGLSLEAAVELALSAAGP
ncbi:MAG TPA: hypothetical protein VMG58_06555, partial [Candidatus Sulfotelmatobacter sp.]|nr:hypothetical protein [Candidatus Sulfotelmatobacter sp.]